ncbi:MAG: hypothetical protein GXP53_08130 [Deltaproteobacteria bacterium]|nr:hypothetical protein [Deltaproteobacteria bacterium]
MLRDSIVKNATVKSGTKRFFGLMVVGYFLPVLILFSFYLGDMTIATQNRFVLFLLPLLIWPTVYTLSRLYFFSGHAFKYEISVFLVFHFIYFLPYGGEQYLANSLLLPYEYEKTICVLKNNYGNNKRILVIADNPSLYLIQKYSAVSIQYINAHMAEVKKMSAQYDHLVILDRHDAGRTASHISLIKKLDATALKTFKLGPNTRMTLYESADF